MLHRMYRDDYRDPRAMPPPPPLWVRALLCVILWLIILAILFTVVSLIAFQWRNPKANDVTTVRYIFDALCWHRIPTFQ